MVQKEQKYILLYLAGWQMARWDLEKKGLSFLNDVICFCFCCRSASFALQEGVFCTMRPYHGKGPFCINPCPTVEKAS